jgi:hypothetical protein
VCAGFADFESAEKDSGARSKLSDMALLHVLPPVEAINGLWTAPFFTE